MLGQLFQASKGVIPDQFTQLCIAAMFKLTFHGFLRIGKITVRPGVSFDHVIQRSDLVIVSNRNKSSLQLIIRHAKYQPLGRRIVLKIHAQATNCLLSHIGQYLNTRGSSPGPLFILPDRSPISRGYFASQLTACLSHADYDSNQYKCHSFRIGVATTAATRGFTDAQIQTMGGWRSGAFRRDIQIPMVQL